MSYYRGWRVVWNQERGRYEATKDGKTLVAIARVEIERLIDKQEEK